MRGPKPLVRVPATGVTIPAASADTPTVASGSKQPYPAPVGTTKHSIGSDARAMPA